MSFHSEIGIIKTPLSMSAIAFHYPSLPSSSRLKPFLFFHSFGNRVPLVWELGPQGRQPRREDRSLKQDNPSSRLSRLSRRTSRTSRAAERTSFTTHRLIIGCCFTVCGEERAASLEPYAWNFAPRAVASSSAASSVPPHPYCLEPSSSCRFEPWTEDLDSSL